MTVEKQVFRRIQSLDVIHLHCFTSDRPWTVVIQNHHSEVFSLSIESLSLHGKKNNSQRSNRDVLSLLSDLMLLKPSISHIRLW